MFDDDNDDEDNTPSQLQKLILTRYNNSMNHLGIFLFVDYKITTNNQTAILPSYRSRTAVSMHFKI